MRDDDRDLEIVVPEEASGGRLDRFLASELDRPRSQVRRWFREGRVAIGGRQADFKFAHSAVHELEPFRLLDSYHCSRYNTNTGRLTTGMFEGIFAQARELLDK